MDRHNDQHPACQGYEDIKSQRHSNNSCSGASTPGNATDVFSKMGSSRVSKKHEMGLSCSDADLQRLTTEGAEAHEKEGEMVYGMARI
ncbi:hypothetical protein QN277_018161 [Acacia crassicarpa]|uniref:Uncharacterized protein n=1 Tax=Acacia crassicarpa TaxID=499986 RepID=A0AAE1MUI0_9FABA|nr:hypothetical protein QN277_018161 [Acacia crassicarpa]